MTNNDEQRGKNVGRSAAINMHNEYVTKVEQIRCAEIFIRNRNKMTTKKKKKKN